MPDDVHTETLPNPFIDAVGTLKWFSAAKGYGFIIPHDGQKDVLIHHSVILQAKLETPREGALIHFTYQVRTKGPQCMSVASVDNSCALEPVELPWVTCTVKWWNAKRGYGFCTDEHNEDIFLHAIVVKRFLRQEAVEAGVTLEVQREKNERGWAAKRVRR